ncbi:hypothetical protein D6789_01135 [Candidatus Woesearchaeota archaeon]|nr:MAG: hypothetical protein D6789_01135 [Candidatus Woesearchaeota archaeon]
MESVDAARERARRKIGVADHILTQTYPLVRDPKLLLAVLQNIFDSVDANVEAALRSLLEKKKVLHIPELFESRLQVLAQQCPLEKSLLRFARELQETMHEHKQSPVEFARKEMFVICDSSYGVRTLRPEQLKRYVQHARAFHTVIGEHL